MHKTYPIIPKTTSRTGLFSLVCNVYVHYVTPKEVFCDSYCMETAPYHVTYYFEEVISFLSWQSTKSVGWVGVLYLCCLYPFITIVASMLVNYHAHLVRGSFYQHSSTKIKSRITNSMHFISLRNMVTFPYSDFNNDLAEQPVELWHIYVIKSHSLICMCFLIRVLIKFRIN